jgi:S1-C subfamily serine protease
VIVKVGDTPIADPDDLSAAINLLEPGQEVDIEIRRGDDTRTVSVKLEERPVGNLDRQP